MRIALASLALLLVACRMHPCGEHEAEAPPKLADAPIIQEGGKICHADTTNEASGSVTVMYWGDERSKLGLLYTAAFDAAGWKEACGEWASKDQLCFEKGDLRVDIHMTQTETPRFGAKMWEPSISAMVFWTVLK
jgi:hypothetical protein